MQAISIHIIYKAEAKLNNDFVSKIGLACYHAPLKHNPVNIGLGLQC